MVDKSQARPSHGGSDQRRKREDDCKKSSRGRKKRLLAVANQDVPVVQRLPNSDQAGNPRRDLDRRQRLNDTADIRDCKRVQSLRLCYAFRLLAASCIATCFMILAPTVAPAAFANGGACGFRLVHERVL